MITIQEDVWRADCIAMIGLADDRFTVNIQPTFGTALFQYTYGTEAEAVSDFKRVVTDWKQQIGAI
jgi:hypothetical protein